MLCLLPGPELGDMATSRAGVQGSLLPVPLCSEGNSNVFKGLIVTLGQRRHFCGYWRTCILEIQIAQDLNDERRHY